VIHGDAGGADRGAEHVAGMLLAPARRLTVIRVPPLGLLPDRYHRRNVAMAALLDGPDDWAEAFLSGAAVEWTTGSADMARILERAGVPCNAHWRDGSRQGISGVGGGMDRLAGM
jgi:hypothetical protein